MSLSLWLVAAPPAAPDEARGLAPSERARLVAARRLFRQLDLRFERLVHAPLLGSLASAHLLAKRVDGETVCDPRLSLGRLEALLPELEGLERVAVVAAPDSLARLAALLVTGHEDDAARFDLSPGAPLHCAGAPRPGGMQVRGTPPSGAL